VLRYGGIAQRAARVVSGGAFTGTSAPAEGCAGSGAPGGITSSRIGTSSNSGVNSCGSRTGGTPTS